MLEIRNDNDLIITDDSGKEMLFKILFYFHNDNRNKDYYFIFKEEDPDEIIVMASLDGQSLEEVDDEEFEEAQEVFDAYENDPKINEIK